MKKASISSLIIICLFGGSLGYFALQQKEVSSNNMNNKPAEKEILYWVAPMDPNFRRDEPGLSPMGMELVPVYKQSDVEETPTNQVSISPAIENQLGVSSIKVQTKSLSQKINTFGKIQFNEDSISHMHTRVEGWIESLSVKAVGDRVKKGQVLFELYSPELVNAQEELILALSKHANDKAKLIQGAERKLRSLGITQTKINELKRTKKVTETMPFYAHHDGYVSMLEVREGMYITPNTMTLSFADLNQVWLIAEVLAKQSDSIQLGQNVSMSLDYFPGKTWQGKVDYIYPVLDSLHKTLRVRVVFDNPGELLKPNMVAEVTIQTQANEVLSIPLSAVIATKNESRVVLDLGEGKFLSTKIETGKQYGDDIEVLSGPKEGDKVVIAGSFLIDSESNTGASFERLDTRPEKADTTESLDNSDHEHMNHGHMNHGHMNHAEPDNVNEMGEG